MQAELSSDPAGSTPGEAPDIEMDNMRRQAVERQKEAERSGPVENEEHMERKEKRQDDQPTNIETKSWLEDLRATWIGY